MARRTQPDGGTTLYCFSPPVMMATFIIESALALYTWFTQRGVIARLSIVLMLCLAAFQLSEYNVCEGGSETRMAWTRFGLVCITMLPALGVHLGSLLTRKTPLVPIGYAIAISFGLAFAFMPDASAAGHCLGNYVLIALPYNPLGRLYSIYYTGYILIGMAQMVWGMLSDRTSSRILYWTRVWFIGGYLSFTVPMAIVSELFPATRNGFPSIMCGFALSLAFIVALRVVPLSWQVREELGISEDEPSDKAPSYAS